MRFASAGHVMKMQAVKSATFAKAVFEDIWIDTHVTLGETSMCKSFDGCRWNSTNMRYSDTLSRKSSLWTREEYAEPDASVNFAAPTSQEPSIGERDLQNERLGLERK